MARIRLRHCHVRFIDGYTAEAAVNGAPADKATSINITFDGGVIPVGTRFEMAGVNEIYTITAVSGTPDTTSITFTPALDEEGAGLPLNEAVITIQGRMLNIKVGDGSISYDTARTVEYEMDRGLIDAAVEGDDVPVAVNMSLTYEYLTALTGSDIPTPKDALKQRGEAADWVTAGADPCEPYAVKIEIDYHPPCDIPHEITVLPEFRAESINHDLQGSTLSVRGQCKVKDVTPIRRAY
jgi:hypothetical protein